MATKICTKCQTEKPLKDFALRSPSIAGIHENRCKQCKQAAAKKAPSYNRRSPAQKKLYDEAYRNTEKGRLRCKRRRVRAYGLTVEEFDKMFTAQGGLCAICQKPETLVRKSKSIAISIDHEHATGKVRELLCARCNTMLGSVADDPNILQNAINYLDKHGIKPVQSTHANSGKDDA